MKPSEVRTSKSQSIYEVMPKSTQEKMDSHLEILNEKVKANPTIAKMQESWEQETPKFLTQAHKKNTEAAIKQLEEWQKTPTTLEDILTRQKIRDQQARS